MQLAQVMPWPALAELVLPDLKRTTAKGQWWRGRKLKLRIHLAALLLQWLYNLTDRQVEWAMKDNAAYQLFCGCCIAWEDWHAPEPTKSEAFRSRLSPETQRQIAHQVAVWAAELGFADPSKMVQMTLLVNKVWTYMQETISFFADFIPTVDIQAVKAKARSYWFRDRKDAAQTQTAFADLWREALTQSCQVKKYFEVLLDYDIERMPWNIRRALDQVNEYCAPYFLHVASFMCRGVMGPEKALSFPAKAIRGFNQGKLGKELPFGRAFQVGRLGGNFLVAGSRTSRRMEDTDSVRPMMGDHEELFGQGTLKSCGPDKGYYSAANRKYLEALEGLDEFCLQQPEVERNRVLEGEAAIHARLVNRRSGIEPLLGHAQHGGQLGQSRMKQDETTLAAGYSAVGGFNLRQLVRHLLGKKIKAMG